MDNKKLAKMFKVPPLKGVSIQQIKKMAQHKKKKETNERPKKPIGQQPFWNEILENKAVLRPSKIKFTEPRPNPKLLTDLSIKTTIIGLPEKGSFNAGLVSDGERYVMVYRPDEYSFIGCTLDKSLKCNKDFFKFNINNCADPRLVWVGDKLLMIYSSTEEVGLRYECIRGCVIMENGKFVHNKPFRVSPESGVRQKNWTPFVHENKLYLVASISPHIIYELDMNTLKCEQKFETHWISPWMFKEFLRGNTNPVRLDDGNYLGTFHTAVWLGQKCFYDNGCYLFEGKPPFRVLNCANRTYLPAESAIQKHFRKKDSLVCTFPVGMVKENDHVLISYGDNDSVVKIMEAKIQDMLNSMLDVY